MDRAARPGRPSRTRRPHRSARARRSGRRAARRDRHPTWPAPCRRRSAGGPAAWTRRCPSAREPGDVVVGDELRVLDPRHQGRRADRRRERVEGGAHGGVADAVDLRRDPQGGGLRGERAQAFRCRKPHAEPVVGRLGLAGDAVHRFEERGGPRAERAVGEHLEPADPQSVERVGPQRLPAPESGFAGRVELLGADARVDADRQVAGRGEPPVGLEWSAEPAARGKAARIVDRDDAQGDELARERSHGVSHRIDRRAAGRATPPAASPTRAGRPSADRHRSRRITPPGGSDRMPEMAASARARGLASNA